MKKYWLSASLTAMFLVVAWVGYAYANESSQIEAPIEQTPAVTEPQEEVKDSLEELNQLSDRVWKEIEELERNGNIEEAEKLLGEWRKTKDKIGKDLLVSNQNDNGATVSNSIEEMMVDFKNDYLEGEVNEK